MEQRSPNPARTQLHLTAPRIGLRTVPAAADLARRFCVLALAALVAVAGCNTAMRADADADGLVANDELPLAGGDDKPDSGDDGSDEADDGDDSIPLTQAEANLAVLESVDRQVRARFFDKKLLEDAWGEMVEGLRDDVAACEPGAALRALLNERLLGPMRVSHFVIESPEVYRTYHLMEQQGLPITQPGFFLVRMPLPRHDRTGEADSGDGDGDGDGERGDEGGPPADDLDSGTPETVEPGHDGPPRGYFVTPMFEDCVAYRAGVRRGDRVLAVDGVDVERSPLLHDAGSDPGLDSPKAFAFILEADQSLTLTLLRTADGEPFDVTFTSEPTTQVDASKASVRVFEVYPASAAETDADGNNEGEGLDGDAADDDADDDAAPLRIGYVHTWHFLSEDISRTVYDAMRVFQGEKRPSDAADDERTDVDALVIDLRGRGGYVKVIQQLLRPFGQALSGPLARGGWGDAGWVARLSPTWDLEARPVVFLIDHGSRSAKEVYAHEIKREGVGTLVGTNTAGAVLAANYFDLPDGSYLFMPVLDVTNLAKDCVCLEAVGVAPDVEVDDELRYAGGRDPILERGLDVAAEQARALLAGD